MKLIKRAFSSASNDLVLSASMGYTGKETSKTHTEHLEAIKKLNLYEGNTSPLIDFIFKHLDKSDFC